MKSAHNARRVNKLPPEIADALLEYRLGLDETWDWESGPEIPKGEVREPEFSQEIKSLVELGCKKVVLFWCVEYCLKPPSFTVLAWKIHDFISTKGLAMVQIRCLVRFETKSEAFACPNIPQQTVSFFQIFLIGPWLRSLTNGRAVPMAERFCCKLPSGV